MAQNPIKKALSHGSELAFADQGNFSHQRINDVLGMSIIPSTTTASRSYLAPVSTDKQLIGLK